MGELRTALVTGGGGGIGSAICHELVKAGHQVYAAGRDLSRLEELVDSLSAAAGQVHTLQLDVSDPGSVAEATRRASEESGGIDWLVANAGIAVSAPILGSETPVDDIYDQHLAVNFHGSRRVFESLLQGMATRRGGAVMIASSAALVGYGYVSAYAASKHALLGYARCAALETAKQGVTVNVICPHYVDSPMTDAAIERIVEKTGRSREEARQSIEQQNAGGRLVQPAEVAQLSVRLLQGTRTGSVIELPGGTENTVDEGWILDEPAQGES